MSSLLEKLSAGQTQIGLCTMYPSPGVIERIGGDWDFVWIDGQHGQLDYNDMLAQVRACDLVGTGSLVRIPWLEAGIIGKVLDANASGVIVPCVDSVEEAKLAVAAAKFPPLGRRSYGGRRVIDFKGRGYSDSANQDQLLIVQIESPAAVEAAEAIAAIKGVDALMIGPDDLSLRRGRSMIAPRDLQALASDVRAIADAAAKHGKYAMGVGIGEEMFTLHQDSGYQLIVAGGEVMFLAAGSQAASSDARQWVKSQAGKPASKGKVKSKGKGKGPSSPY